MKQRSILAASAAPAVAIAVFGAIYGSLAGPLMGAGRRSSVRFSRRGIGDTGAEATVA